MNIRDLMKVNRQSQIIVIFDKNENVIKKTYNLELWIHRDTEEGKKLLNNQIEFIEPIEVTFKGGNKSYGLKVVLK